MASSAGRQGRKGRYRVRSKNPTEPLTPVSWPVQGRLLLINTLCLLPLVLLMYRRPPEWIYGAHYNGTPYLWNELPNEVMSAICGVAILAALWFLIRGKLRLRTVGLVAIVLLIAQFATNAFAGDRLLLFVAIFASIGLIVQAVEHNRQLIREVKSAEDGVGLWPSVRKAFRLWWFVAFCCVSIGYAASVLLAKAAERLTYAIPAVEEFCVVDAVQGMIPCEAGTSWMTSLTDRDALLPTGTDALGLYAREQFVQAQDSVRMVLAVEPDAGSNLGTSAPPLAELHPFLVAKNILALERHLPAPSVEISSTDDELRRTIDALNATPETTIETRISLFQRSGLLRKRSVRYRAPNPEHARLRELINQLRSRRSEELRRMLHEPAARKEWLAGLLSEGLGAGTITPEALQQIASDTPSEAVRTQLEGTILSAFARWELAIHEDTSRVKQVYDETLLATGVTSNFDTEIDEVLEALRSKYCLLPASSQEYERDPEPSDYLRRFDCSIATSNDVTGATLTTHLGRNRCSWFNPGTWVGCTKNRTKRRIEARFEDARAVDKAGRDAAVEPMQRAGLRVSLHRSVVVWREAQLATLGTQYRQAFLDVDNGVTDGQTAALRLADTVPKTIYLGRDKCRWYKPGTWIGCAKNKAKEFGESKYKEGREAAGTKFEREVEEQGDAGTRTAYQVIADAYPAATTAVNDSAEGLSRGIEGAFRLLGMLKILGVVLLIFALVKSYLYVLAQVIFHVDGPATFRTAAVPKGVGAINSKPGALTLEGFKGNLISKKAHTNQGKRGLYTFFPGTSVVTRLRRGWYTFLNRAPEAEAYTNGRRGLRRARNVAKPGKQIPIVIGCPSGDQLVKWELAPEETVTIQYKNVVAFSEGVTPSATFSLHLDTILTGRVFVHQLHAPQEGGVLILRTSGAPASDLDKVAVFEPSSLVAWSSHSRFRIHAAPLDWRAIYLDGFQLHRTIGTGRAKAHVVTEVVRERWYPLKLIRSLARMALPI